MKFNAYILEKYEMTKEVYNSKPDWAKEELHKDIWRLNDNHNRTRLLSRLPA